MRVPMPRGPISTAVAEVLRGAVRDLPALDLPDPEGASGVLEDDDVQLALWMLHQLHYDDFDGGAAALEWDPALIALRRGLEDLLLADLRERSADVVEAARAEDGGPGLAERLFTMVDSFDGAGTSTLLQREATAEQFAEHLVHRSIYNLRETDPQVFAMPRLPGRAQVAMAELVYDEYGAGRPDRRHSLLFAEAMEACGLDPTPGAYVDVLPATTLAIVNVMHLFALRRDLVAASVGHYGAFEATSSGPSQRASNGAERLGLDQRVRDYFDEHVEADAVHEQLVFRDVCEAVVEVDPDQEELVLLGAASCLVVEDAAAAPVVEAWQADRSSLLAPAAQEAS